MTVALVDYLFWLTYWVRDKFSPLQTAGKLSICLLFCFVLLSTSGCNSAKQRRVNEKANKVFQNLFIPADAILLGKVENDHLLAYAHGCTGTVIEVTYGANRPLAEIIDEYHHALLASGWELHPDYKPNKTDTTAIYQMGPQAHIRLLSTLINTTPSMPQSNEEVLTTTYTVMIIYTEPSNTDCIG